MKRWLMIVGWWWLSVTGVQAQLVINEIYATPANGQPEWLEIYNLSENSVTLTGWQIAELTSGTIKNYEPIAPDVEATIEAHGWWLTVPKKLTLNNSGDTIYLFAPDGATADTITYPKLTSTQAYARIPDGTSTWEITALTPLASNDPQATDEKQPVANYTGTDPTADDKQTAIDNALTVTTVVSSGVTNSQTNTETTKKSTSSPTPMPTPTPTPTPTPAPTDTGDNSRDWSEGIEFRVPKITYATPMPTPASPTAQVLGVSTQLPATGSARITTTTAPTHLGVISVAAAAIIGSMVMLMWSGWLAYQESERHGEEASADPLANDF